MNVTYAVRVPSIRTFTALVAGGYRIVERGGVKVGVVGQAFPYTPIANPRWMFPNWSFGIRENDVAKNVAAVREEGAELVVLLSHNGFDVDRKLAGRVPGIDVTVEDLHNACAMTYPAAYRSPMTGAFLKEILEDVADNLFNADPYYQQGGDMVRVGGMGYRINPTAAIGSRISEMTVLKTGEAIDPKREYVVAGWASVNEATEGPPIWDVVEGYLARNPVVRLEENRSVKVTS
ncbi:probable Mn-dependent hydrolase [alpha proteobacterium BAL199]|nr:probable Mn-dependent hydrolase [alpha proteobacterium BAL199]